MNHGRVSRPLSRRFRRVARPSFIAPPLRWGDTRRYEGTPEQGHFEGTTPLGSFAGTYRVVEDSSELEIKLTKKPWLVSTHLLEREVRKMLTQVRGNLNLKLVFGPGARIPWRRRPCRS